jgi:TonB-linked SusC/RagA family outer membrane protein
MKKRRTQKNGLMHALCMLLIFVSCVAVWGQTKAVSGIVKDSKGDAVIGASVVAKGSSSGTITDIDGKFTLNVQTSSKSVIVSFIGMTSKEVPLTGNKLTVTLTESSIALNEVVAVGYGTQTKRAVTGSVASVNYEKFKDRSYNDVSQALAGQLPGVNVTQSQGAPGQSPVIKIRGISSITAGTSPLYVIDGLPMENFNLNMINPQDVESIEVLKDASSAAIYGSRGANGVILITTKLGKPGKTSVSANYEYGIQEVTRKIDLMDAQQFVKYYVDAHNNAWIAAGGKASDPNSVRGTSYKIPDDFTTNPSQFGKGTDWQDVMFRVAPSHKAQVSVSGGTDKTQFSFSVALLNQKAVLDQNYYKRLSVHSNIKHKISDKVTAGLNVSLAGIYDRTDGTTGKSDVVSLGLQSDPIFPVYNENGNLGYKDPNSTWYRFSSYSDLQLWHPYSLTREIHKQNKTFNTLGSAYLEYEAIKGLKFRTSMNANLYNTRYNSYRTKNQKYGYSSAMPAEGYLNTSFMLNWLSENTITYEKQIQDHSIKALLGYTVQKQRDEYSAETAGSFPNDQVETLNAGIATNATTTATEWAMLSYLGRLNYSYKDRYFLTGTIRRDGSSRFGANNQFGYFPSVSAGWLVSDENFMKDVKAVSSLKAKVSYGLAGNNQIPNYGAISLLGASNYVSGTTLANGQLVTTIQNPDLRWEKTSQFNVGIEAGLFKNRLTLGLEFYNSITKDLLLNVPVPDITGFSTQLTNIGKMRNRGFEVNLTSRNLVGDLKWTTDFNYSLNRNKVLALGPGNAPIVYTDYVVTVKTEVGQPISNFYGYVFDGVYKNQAEINATPHHASTTPGDPIVRDVNGDHQITEADRTTIGNAQPDFTAGITNTLSYKGVELSFMFQGSFGSDICNQLTRYMGIWNGGRNAFASVANYWKSESDPGDGKHFKPTIAPKGLQEKFSSYWIEDGSFVRLRNIRISYELPSAWLAKISVKSGRIFVNAENVLLFTKYTNYDPENTTYGATNYSTTGTSNTGTASSSMPTGAMLGVDYGSYPNPRIITFGVKLDF